MFYAPAGNSDVIWFAQKLDEHWKQSVIVEKISVDIRHMEREANLRLRLETRAAFIIGSTSREFAGFDEERHKRYGPLPNSLYLAPAGDNAQADYPISISQYRRWKWFPQH
jgi:hypothetical protein